DDSFDRGNLILAAIFAGNGYASKSEPTYGRGGVAIAKYYTAAYGDIVIGDFMTEALFPTLLHQDPRYFRRGTGSGWSRHRYAMGQILWTRTDTGKRQFNYSEILGNSAAVAISTSYYPNQRTAADAAAKVSIQIAIDAGGNVLKEFWPDIQRKFFHAKASDP